MIAPKYQFTLFELMGLVAFCGVSLAAIGTPAMRLIVSIWIVLPGLVVDRARGGRGILGGSLAGGFAAEVMLFYYPDLLIRDPILPGPLSWFVFSSLFFIPFGLIYGAVVSEEVCLVIGFLQGKAPSMHGQSEGSSDGPTGPGTIGIGPRIDIDLHAINTGSDSALNPIDRRRVAEPCGFRGSGSPSGSSSG
jgi:hypothetical protein